MEKDKVILTTDGKILKTDVAEPEVQVLAMIAPEEAGHAIRYFEKRYSDLEKYVDASLRTIREDSHNAEKIQFAEKLREEISSAKVIGNVDVLMGKVNSILSDATKETAHSESKPVELSTDAAQKKINNKAEEPNIHNAEDQKDDITTEENPELLAELRGMVDKATELAKEADWQYVQNELENIRYKWNERIAGDETLTSTEAYVELLNHRSEAEKIFAERKAAHQEKRRERKKENVIRRDKILEQLQNVVDKKKWQAFKEVNGLVNRWEEIRELPNDESVKVQNAKFHQLVEEFNKKKVEHLIKTAQKEEENLIGKLAIIDKLEQLVSSVDVNTANWDQLDVNIDELSKQWKKIGHVPLEQSDSIWDRFKSIREEYFNKKFEFNKAFQKTTTKNIQRKTRLCEKAEALLEEKDLALAVREINMLHKQWKKAGPIPKGINEELWERFNTATRQFNEVKIENQDTIRQQEQENLDKKVELCEKAESLKDSTNWDDVSREMDALMKAWKEIGPVPRRKSGKLWQRFKKSLDEFFNKRRDYFREIRSEQKENYDKKREIVTELEKLADHEDPNQAVSLAKELQDRYRNIGYVPIKKKNKIASDYKNVCDQIYQRARSEGKKSVTGSPKSTTSAKSEGDKTIRAEYFKLKKECDKTHEEIMRYQDTITFINPGGQGNELIDEIQQKIDNAQKEMDKKQDKLEELRREMGE